MTARQQVAMNHFVSAGYSPHGAAATVGNLSGESGVNLDSTLFRANPDYSGGVPLAEKSGGIAEWLGDRKAKMIAFAQRQGIDPNDLGIQCDFVIYELQTKWPALDAQLRPPSTRSVENLTANFCWIFESPNRAMARLDNRIAQANNTLSAWMIGQEAKAPVGQAPPPSPATIPAPAQQPPPWAAPAPPMPPMAPLPPVSWTAPPAAAPAAGRISAVLEQIDAIRQKYAADRAAADAEEAVLDTAYASLSKLGPIPAASAPPAPAAQPQPVRSPPVPAISSIFTNYKTSAGGAAALLGAGAMVLHYVSAGQMPDASGFEAILAALSAAWIGFQAKDNNVTGGTVPATPEAAQRVASQ